jgi:hypothetical protein
MLWIKDLIDAVVSLLKEKFVFEGLDLDTTWGSFATWLKSFV